MSITIEKRQDAASVPTGTDLCLLSLDGGGVRGISSLMILKKLMEAVDSKNPPRPCDYFDMIGGTSTGGLIAIMLGRMRLTVDECIEAYSELSPNVFTKVHHRIKLTSGETQGRFDHVALEKGIKKILKTYRLDVESLLKEPQEGISCKVFVCATSKQTGRPVIFSSYYNPRRGEERLNKAKIWQAARATSAATTFFDPIEIGGETFVDGATGANNPVNYLWSEADDVWGHGDGLDPAKVKCLVSIGTGVPALSSFDSDIPGIAKALKAISTDTEETASMFQNHHSKLFQSGNAFRFNVTRGLELVGLQEVRKWNEIKAATQLYIQQEDTFVKLKKCALMLQERSWVKELTDTIIQSAKPCINYLNDIENHISEADLQWLMHTTTYEKWVTGRATSSTLWYRQLQNPRQTNREFVAASISQLLPDVYEPFAAPGTMKPKSSRTLYYQCLPDPSFDIAEDKVEKPAISGQQVMACLICQAFLLGSEEPKTLSKRLMTLNPVEREQLGVLLRNPEALDIDKLGDLLITAIATSGRPASIAIDNFHLLKGSGYIDLLQMVTQSFDKQFQSKQNNILIILTGSLSHGFTSLEKVQSIDDYTEYNECIQSLHFPEWNSRRDQVEKADEGTNQWVWRHPQYQAWDQADRGLLWIEGKAGSGKSVLARSMQRKILATSGRTTTNLSTGSRRQRPPDSTSGSQSKVAPIVAGWFYSTRLGEVGMSNISLLRSIIYEILGQEPRFFDAVVKFYRKCPVATDPDDPDSNKAWCSSEDFELTGRQILEQMSRTGRSMICIVDAMDEAKTVLQLSSPLERDMQRKPRIRTLLKTLSSMVIDIEGSRMKFIILSRPEPMLEMDFVRAQRGSNLVSRITLQHENAGDIALLVDRGLKNLQESMHTYDSDDEPSPTRYRNPKRGQRGLSQILRGIQESEENILDRIRSYMLENTRGVLLWVTLILKDLLETASSGMTTFAELESRLKSLPLELDELYDRIISDLVSKLNNKELLKSRGILMLIAGFGSLGRPLKLQEIWEALAVPLDVSQALESTADPIVSNRVIIRSWIDFRRQLNKYCSYLIEVISQEDDFSSESAHDVGPDDIVQFIHRTVKDFLAARDHTENFYIAEDSAQVEVKSLASRYTAIAFPSQKTSYCPAFRAAKGSSWKENVEEFVTYMNLRILFSFVVSVSSVTMTSDASTRLGIDGAVLDGLVWPSAPQWTDDKIGLHFGNDSRFYPGAMGTFHSVDTVRATLLGHAFYYACHAGLVTATENLYLVYQRLSPNYTRSNSHVMGNGALRVAIENRLLEETKKLTWENRHQNEGGFIVPRQRSEDSDPFLQLACASGGENIVSALRFLTSQFNKVQNRVYLRTVTMENVNDIKEESIEEDFPMLRGFLGANYEKKKGKSTNRDAADENSHANETWQDADNIDDIRECIRRIISHMNLVGGEVESIIIPRQRHPTQDEGHLSQDEDHSSQDEKPISYKVASRARKIRRKLITSPFKPKLKSETDVSYFDSEFTTALGNDGSLNERAQQLATGFATSTSSSECSSTSTPSVDKHSIEARPELPPDEPVLGNWRN